MADAAADGSAGRVLFVGKLLSGREHVQIQPDTVAFLQQLAEPVIVVSVHGAKVNPRGISSIGRCWCWGRMRSLSSWFGSIGWRREAERPRASASGSLRKVERTTGSRRAPPSAFCGCAAMLQSILNARLMSRIRVAMSGCT